MAKRMLETDCCKIMREIARWAGIPEGGFHRMVLVLDVDSVPQLFTEGIAHVEEGDSLHLPMASVNVQEQAVQVEMANGLKIGFLPAKQHKLQDEALPTEVDTTTQRNEKWRIKTPMPLSKVRQITQEEYRELESKGVPTAKVQLVNEPVGEDEGQAMLDFFKRG